MDGLQPPALLVEIREPLRLLREALAAAFTTCGIGLLDGDTPRRPGDLVIWSVDAAGGVDAVTPFPAGVDVVALLEEPTPDTVAQLVAAGARAVLHRGSDPWAVVGATLVVAEGYAVVPPSSLAGAPRRRCTKLEGRELEWMRALAAGGAVATLAAVEGYSEREMYRKLRGVYRGLGAANRSEALVILAQAGLLHPR